MNSVVGAVINFILVVCSSMVALAALEIVLRLYVPASDQAVYMMSLPSLAKSAEGVVGYSSNIEIRSVAVDRAGIVYEARFHTNNLGFVDNVNYERGHSGVAIAILGDSFTAGYHGGSPWITQVHSALGSTASVFNLGISGTGVRDFEQRLNQFATFVDVDEIYILVISNDFYRRLWYPVSNADGLWLCSHDEGETDCLASKPPTFYSVELHASTDEVLSKAEAIRAARPSHSQGSRVHGLLKDLFWRLQVSDQLADPDVQDSLQAVLRIVDRYGRDRVTVVHLPEKHEVVRKRYDLDISKFAAANRINYIPLQENCPLNESMYFERDAHPNAEGYRHIAQCMIKIIASRSLGALE